MHNTSNIAKQTVARNVLQIKKILMFFFILTHSSLVTVFCS